jgi:RNA polymerase sigma-70 factor (ECF subfamily)
VIDIDTIYRAERGRVLASLIRLLGGFDLAEDALAEAFLAAAQQWPRTGVPDNPRTWLVSAGRFKAIDKLRKSGRFRNIAPELTRQLELEEDQMPPDREAIEDDTLRLIFTCCHPVLPLDAQIALTLREVCGLTTEEIAAAYLSKPSAIAQRIVRAKSRIRDAALPYEVPPPAEWPDRLDAVLHTIYLIFNEGYDASSGDTLVRQDLCAEAVRLTRLLRELHPTPDIDGLLGLLLLHQSRAATRTGPGGQLVLLEDQDRTSWDRDLVAQGTALAEQASPSLRSAPTPSRP